MHVVDVADRTRPVRVKKERFYTLVFCVFLPLHRGHPSRGFSFCIKDPRSLTKNRFGVVERLTLRLRRSRRETATWGADFSVLYHREEYRGCCAVLLGSIVQQ
jgi:hypothetical protein